MQVSRSKDLKIPKQIELVVKHINNIDDEVATKEAIIIANDKNVNKEKIKEEILEKDLCWEQTLKVPANSNDLIVITSLKRLGAYVIAITEKSPAKYRGVFVNRMQN